MTTGRINQITIFVFKHSRSRLKYINRIKGSFESRK